MPTQLIADSGATKTEWCLVNGRSKKTFLTQGLSPYFLSSEQIEYIIQQELKVKLKNVEPAEIYFYGTGCSNKDNVKLVKKAIQKMIDKKAMFDGEIVLIGKEGKPHSVKAKDLKK